jgi:purine-nucleoside phosphorylase
LKNIGIIRAVYTNYVNRSLCRFMPTPVVVQPKRSAPNALSQPTLTNRSVSHAVNHFDYFMYTPLQESLAYIRNIHPLTVEAGVILGTGLGGLAREIQIEHLIPYGDIPHFPISTVEGHHGRLIIGWIGEVSVVVMQGRFHLYEGYTAKEIAHSVRLMKLMGIGKLYLSNVSGSVNPAIKRGSLIAIEDHLNLQGTNPLIGPNDDTLGPRFPDMSEPYDKGLIAKAQRIAEKMGIVLRTGVYAAVVGPNLETRAEYRMLRTIGADLVGMSTVPEVTAARHMGIPVFAISLVTDEGDPDNLVPVDIQEILAIAHEHEPKLSGLLRALIAMR